MIGADFLIGSGKESTARTPNMSKRHKRKNRKGTSPTPTASVRPLLRPQSQHRPLHLLPQQTVTVLVPVRDRPQHLPHQHLDHTHRLLHLELHLRLLPYTPDLGRPDYILRGKLPGYENRKKRLDPRLPRLYSTSFPLLLRLSLAKHEKYAVLLDAWCYN